jgi:hypothetical protein
MIQINKHLFDLTEVFDFWTQSDTWYITTKLKMQKQDIINCMQYVEDVSICAGQYKEEKTALSEQLFYIETNLKTLEDALLQFESLVSEKHEVLKDLDTIYLN